MVVCEVVRLRNASPCTFEIQAEDIFHSSPTIGGLPVKEEYFEVPPGFDAEADGLVVPWFLTSIDGLVIREAESGCILRCSVGPKVDNSNNSDWLQLHCLDWDPVNEESWLELGQRHFVGAIGHSVQLQLTFRQPRLLCPGMLPGASLGHGAKDVPTDQMQQTQSVQGPIEASTLATWLSFASEVESAPACTVFLNVYDLAPVTSVVNSFLCNTMVKTFGAFHATIEIYGQEWGFYRQADPEQCGVCRSLQPRQHPIHVYRQSVNLGQTRLTEAQTYRLVRSEVAKLWPSKRYDLIHCNCIHFCEDLAQRLGAKPVPGWVRGLHETGAAAASLVRGASAMGRLLLGRQQGGSDPLQGQLADETQDFLRAHPEATASGA
ncbi:unnamed protein product [Symbiodinium sp. CCMP2456]|nr:unnamed protein product [Symbiodinium sp. CCMP2456]